MEQGKGKSQVHTLRAVRDTAQTPDCLRENWKEAELALFSCGVWLSKSFKGLAWVLSLGVVKD